ncbi:TetR/AcrR family transcriptional regulator [Lactonifactor longoviformis]|uniref:TetR/AcrR family transcriptional regulator n=1 Tax=Lactonifactor longoviformis TaxID=341220 RepID=UPI0009326E96|nr:TetR/AcrR family transcriptional regulator [Lactonifactor longoviformis]POP32548.1 TetR/AcrR family transcriptional regulator [Lactonifactor longoviformis]
MKLNSDRKIEYVRITSKILEEEGIEAVTIRKVAARAGCTSAVLYRHFENKGHLTMLACIRFLEPYIYALMKNSERKDISLIQRDLLNWKCFIGEAFRNRPYYEFMFFGNQREELEECAYEYYQMFPDIQKSFDAFTASIAFSSDLHERAVFYLRSAVHTGMLTSENAMLLGRLSVAVFKGSFMEYAGIAMTETEIRMASEECYQLIYSLYKQYVEPGTKLEIDE